MMSIRLLRRSFSARFYSTATEDQNVDSRDVKHHASFSQNWWDQNGPMKGLHAMNQVRVPLIRDGLVSTGRVDVGKINKPNVLEGIKLLEVGCGAGILTEALAKLHAEIVALEPSPELIATANAHFWDEKLLKIEFICDTAENHSVCNHECYDAVVVSEVLEHIKDQKSFLKSCVDCLKPGGSIFVTTFNKTQSSWIGGIIAAEYILHLVPQNTHNWNQFISPSELEKILKELNCQTILTHGIKYEFWRNACTWSRCTDINYALHAVKEST